MKIEFGALSDKLSKQIPGLPEVYDDISRSVTMLYLHGYISDSASMAIRKKIVKRIEKEIKLLNNKQDELKK
jgi:hypothetical protein